MAKRTANRHHRELIELAALFGAAGLADLFTDLLGRRSAGPSILVAVAIVLAVSTVGHHLWLRYSARRRSGSGALRTAAGRGSGGAAELAPSGQLWRVRTAVEDTPGRLAVIAGALAGVGANILSTQVHPSGTGAVDEFLVETPDGVGADRLVGALAAAGGGQPHAAPVDIHALVDPSVHALALAHRLARDPDALPDVVRDLLGAERADVVVEGGSDDGEEAEDVGGVDDDDATVMCLRACGTGSLVVVRPAVPFTPTEFGRARAMVDLAEALRDADGAGRAHRCLT